MMLCPTTRLDTFHCSAAADVLGAAVVAAVEVVGDEAIAVAAVAVDAAGGGHLVAV